MITITTPSYFTIIVPRMYRLVWEDRENILPDTLGMTRLIDTPSFQRDRWDIYFFCERNYVTDEYGEEMESDDITTLVTFTVEFNEQIVYEHSVCKDGIWVSPEEFTNSLKIEETYNLCNCYREIKLNNQCNDCYIFHYENEDRCSVCLDNGGQWSKLQCGHIFHSYCIDQVEKCPLCRRFKKIEMTHYPFF